jgi:tryptophan halogenase
VIDCTGFSRKIIGQVFKEEWVNYKDSLPVDRALPFFISNNTEKIPPYTEAIAMKYGWVWKIPVQGRYGCGYVFDSDYVSDEEIKKEIVETFGDVEIPRFFSFKAGYFKNTWVKNCVALGLSSGFIEPLEATSIWVTIASLNIMLRDCEQGFFGNEQSKVFYNNKIRKLNEQIKDFIQLHYITKRNDSPFWKEYQTKNKIATSILEFNKCKNAIEMSEVSKKYFKPFLDVYSVFGGVNIYNQKMFEEHFESLVKLPENKNYFEKLESFKKELKIHSDFKAIDHYKFLNYINKNF